MKPLPRVTLRHEYYDESYSVYEDDLMKHLHSYLELDIVTASIFDDIVSIFLSGDLEKIKSIRYERL